MRRRLHVRSEWLGSRPLPAFTLVEMLVVVAIISTLVAILMPALHGVRRNSGISTCANNLKQLGQAATAYLATYKDHLPQVVALNPMTQQQEVIGTLFGGKRGTLEMFGVNEWGADRRPLNKFLSGGSISDDQQNAPDVHREDLPAFQCPLDNGQPAQPPFLPQVESMYDFVGSSYTLNDHTLDSEEHATLVPKRTGTKPGGRMPLVENTSKTWLLGDLPVYNYQQGGDRQQHWHGSNRQTVVCNMCFCDGHVGYNMVMPQATFGPEGCINENTTKEYTFLPARNWLSQTIAAPHCPPCGGTPP